MKKIALFIFIIFSFSAIFGVFGMNHEICFTHGGCLFEVVQNNLTVPKEEKNWLILLAVASVFLISFGLNNFSKNAKLFLYFLKRILNEFIHLFIQLAHWLAILINSPSRI